MVYNIRTDAAFKTSVIYHATNTHTQLDSLRLDFDANAVPV